MAADPIETHVIESLRVYGLTPEYGNSASAVLFRLSADYRTRFTTHEAKSCVPKRFTMRCLTSLILVQHCTSMTRNSTRIASCAPGSLARIAEHLCPPNGAFSGCSKHFARSKSTRFDGFAQIHSKCASQCFGSKYRQRESLLTALPKHTPFIADVALSRIHSPPVAKDAT